MNKFRIITLIVGLSIMLILVGAYFDGKLIVFRDQRIRSVSAVRYYIEDYRFQNGELPPVSGDSYFDSILLRHDSIPTAQKLDYFVDEKGFYTLQESSKGFVRLFKRGKVTCDQASEPRIK